MLFWEKVLFYLFIFCLSFQTRKIIYSWGAFFNEWQSAFFYLTDLLFILLIVLWLRRQIQEKQLKIKISWLVVFLLAALFSVWKADNWQLSLYQWLKLLQLATVFWYIKNNLYQLIKPRLLAGVIIANGLLQSVIAILQFLQQKSLGLRFLGESYLAADIPGVAKFFVDDKLFIRSYGTLPHANVLAAFLVFVIFIFYWFYLTKQDYSLFKNLYLGAIYAVIFIGLATTYSRTALAVFVLGTIVFLIAVFKKYQPQVRLMILLFIMLCVIFGYSAYSQVLARALISGSDQSVTLRLYYNDLAYENISDKPVWGMGLGNFVWQFTQNKPSYEQWLYQPVHNLYLLIFCELGFMGFVAFIYFLFRTVWHKPQNLFHFTFLIIFCLFLLLGFFDHYFWTLQQGRLMFWLVLGALASGKK